MTHEFVIELLGAQDRSAFTCGAEPLDRYLRERASQDIKRLMASCFVAMETAKPKPAIAGYYTLSATSVLAEDLPEPLLKCLPRYAVLPAALIGRLAVDQRFQGKGVGSVLLADAALRVVKGDTTAFALIVEAKDANAVAFYQHQGFCNFISRPTSLFLTLNTAKKAHSIESAFLTWPLDATKDHRTKINRHRRQKQNDTGPEQL